MDAARGGGGKPAEVCSIGRWGFAPFPRGFGSSGWKMMVFHPKMLPRVLGGSWIWVSLCGARHRCAATESKAVAMKTPFLPPPCPQKGKFHPKRRPSRRLESHEEEHKMQNGAIPRDLGSLLTRVMGKSHFVRPSRRVHVSKVGTGLDGRGWVCALIKPPPIKSGAQNPTNLHKMRQNPWI